MTDEHALLRRIRRLEEALAADGGNENNSSGACRLEIASEYQKLGRASEAARWFLEAAKYAEFSESAIAALAAAKAAVRAAPEDLTARRDYRRLWRKYVGDGGPDPA